MLAYFRSFFAYSYHNLHIHYLIEQLLYGSVTSVRKVMLLHWFLWFVYLCQHDYAVTVPHIAGIRNG